MKKTKIALTLVCAILLVAASVMGTLAYLTAETDSVTNTFTVGNVKFDGNGLDEADVNQYGELLNNKGEVYDATKSDTLADRVTENTYKLVPGHNYVKDPTVHIAANNEDCWVFVKVVNPISGIEKADVADATGTTIAAQMTANGWTAVDATNAPGVYYNSSKYTTQNTVKDYVVFSSFTLKDDATLDTSYNPITVQAALVQADGFDSATAAWAAVGSSLFQDADEAE